MRRTFIHDLGPEEPYDVVDCLPYLEVRVEQRDAHERERLAADGLR